MKSQKRESNQLLARSIAAIVIIVTMIACSWRNDGQSIIVVPKEECYRDLPYDALDEWNTFSLAEPWFKDLILNFNDFWYDVSILGFLILLRQEALNCSAFFIALGLNVGCKGFV